MENFLLREMVVIMVPAPSGGYEKLIGWYVMCLEQCWHRVVMSGYRFGVIIAVLLYSLSINLLHCWRQLSASFLQRGTVCPLL